MATVADVALTTVKAPAGWRLGGDWVEEDKTSDIFLQRELCFDYLGPIANMANPEPRMGHVTSICQVKKVPLSFFTPFSKTSRCIIR